MRWMRGHRQGLLVGPFREIGRGNRVGVPYVIQVRIDRQRAWVEGLELPITDAMYDEMTVEAWRKVKRLRARGNRGSVLP
jgi:hypothetical protein